MRVLFISLELLGPVFSGNGIYSRSLVRALKTTPGLACLVLSGRSAAMPFEAQDAEWREQRDAPHGLIDIPLDVWGRLDRGSGWASFRDQAASPAVAATVAAFAPDVVVAVDWHGAHAWEGLCGALRALAAAPGSSAPAAARAAACRCVYLNFRVYCTSTGLAATADDLRFFRSQERAAMRLAACTVALCRVDALALAALAGGTDPVSRGPLDAAEAREGDTHPPAVPEEPDIRVLLPPIRQDVLDLQLQRQRRASEDGAVRRDLIVCAVRASPEKGLHRLAGWLAALRPTLEELQLTPYVCGVRASASPYAAEALAAITAACPAALLEEAFMGPAELCAVWGRAALNVHPCLADAYGMTVVEAAACGAPSLVHIAAEAAAPASAPLTEAAVRCFESGWGRAPDGEAASSAPATGFMRLVLARATGGASRLADDAPRAWPAVAAELLGAPLPTVGACDLLAPGSAGGIVAVDMTRPDAEVAAVVAAALRAGPQLRAVAAQAEASAFAWTESLSRDALLSVLREFAHEEEGPSLGGSAEGRSPTQTR